MARLVQRVRLRGVPAAKIAIRNKASRVRANVRRSKA